MSTIVITPNNPQYSTTGPWSAWAGAWGAGSLTYGVDYTQSITLNNTTFPNGTLFSWSFPLYGGPFGVWSYPCIVYGSTPELINPTVPSTQVANFVNLSTTYSAALTVNSGQLDTIFDIWLTSKPYGDMTTAKYELEIIPQTVWHYSPLTYTFTDLTLQNANVYVNPNWGGNGLTNIVVAPSSEMLTGTISISDILKSLIWHGVITGQEYISGIEFGPEPGSGSGSLLINNLSYQWNGRSTVQGTGGNDTFQITAPGGNDVVGNGGIDTLIYSALYSQFQIKTLGSETLVTENNDISTLDYLQGVTNIRFADGTYNTVTSTFVPASPSPKVTSVAASGTGITNGNGDLNAGHVITVTLNMSGVVSVSGGTPTLTLNDGGTASYAGGSSSNALTFSYTVAAGENTPDLAVTAFNLNGATITDGAGNNAAISGNLVPAGTLQIDTVAPTVTSVAASEAGISNGNGDLNAGHIVTLKLAVSEAVAVVAGTPTLTLNDGGTAAYTGGSGTNALTFSYAVAPGQNTPDLTVTGVNLNGAAITDGAGNNASIPGTLIPVGTLQIDTTAPTVTSVAASGTGITFGNGDLDAGHVVKLTLNMSETVTVAGGTPTLTVNDGGTATYIGGSGSGALTFSYTVAPGQNTPDLTVTRMNPNGAAIKDGAGNNASIPGTLIPVGTLQIDTTAPTVTSVAASGTGITFGNGDLDAGHVVKLTLNMSETVIVVGGTPTLTLNDGGTAAYTGGSGTNALTFSYTVAPGQNTPDLTVTGVNLNGAAITDGAENNASIPGTLIPDGTLQIDTTTTAPTVTSVAASGTGITFGNGDLDAGHVVKLTLNMSETVTVAGGTPTLTLNDGGTATYTGGSGSSALTFSYTVAAGQNIPDLAVTAFNLKGATVADGAKNIADLTDAVINPAGILQIDTTPPPPPVIATDTVNQNKTVTLAGTAEAGSTITVYEKRSALGQTHADASGAWSFITVPLSNGFHTFAATATDAAGNTSALSKSIDPAVGATILQTDTNSYGSTSLTEVASNYYLFDLTGAGPELSYAGVGIMAGQFGALTTPIGAVQTASGYDVAWHNTSTNLYAVWATNSSANYTGTLIGAASGNSYALESFESVFHQDLNGDGVVGLATMAIQTDGATTLTQVANRFYLDGSDGSGPALKYGGGFVTAGEFGALTPIGAVQTASGYDVAWHNTSTNLYSVWATNSSANYTGTLIGAASGNSYALESFESVFQQDLNGDGVIGLTTTAIQIDGATTLTQVANRFYLDGSNGSGPALKYGGGFVTAGEFGASTPIGAVQTASGYDVAWHNTSTNLYAVWATNSSGNYTGTLIGAASGNSYALESFESVFHQDLNGDGVVGLATMAIQTDGATTLTQVANRFYLDGSDGSGPALKYGGGFVTAGEFGALTPIGAVQTASGYDVAWHNTSTNLYSVWATNSSGNYTSTLIGAASGNSYALESFESVFHQDLNGDGVAGLATMAIQTDGATTLTQVANRFYLDGSDGSGPALKYGGGFVTAGEFGALTPIGAVQTASGYDVAWHNTSTNLYSVWATNSSGNYTSTLIGAASGNSYALESFELVFHQDLNGDGVVGLYVPSGSISQVNQALSGASGGSTIGAAATLELAAADSAAVVFATSTGMLKLDQPSSFSGTIFGFTGNGSLSGSDQIDLKGINFSTVQDSYAGGALTVTDGTHSATLNFHGTYTLANFKFADDGNGGTIVYDPPAPSLPSTKGGTQVSIDSGNDAFVFHPNFSLSASELKPETMPNHNEHAEFAATHSTMHDAHENIIADFAHDATAAHNAALAQLHQSHLLV